MSNQYLHKPARLSAICYFILIVGSNTGLDHPAPYSMPDLLGRDPVLGPPAAHGRAR